MRVLVTGATGFIGRPLCRELVKAGHAVTAVTRDPARAKVRVDPAVRLVGWQGFRGPTQELTTALAENEVVINLAGEPIAARRWSPQVKSDLRASREGTTSALVTACAKQTQRPVLFVSGSAIGYYGPRGDDVLTEESPSGSGFLASLCREWEGAARAAERLGVRVALIRIGVVLGRDGGALGKMLPAFKLGLGGPLGKGNQWMSWIHLEDLVRLFIFIMEQAPSGPVNATAPEPVTNRRFVRTLGRVLHRPAWLPAPGFAVKLLLGEMAEELLLTGQRVTPARAQTLGFHFLHPDLTGALQHLVGTR